MAKTDPKADPAPDPKADPAPDPVPHPAAGGGDNPFGDLDDSASAFMEAQGVKTPADALKVAMSLNGKLGSAGDRMFEIPREDDPEAEAKTAALYEKLGRPKEAKDYQLPEKLEALKFEGERQEKYFGLFHRHGLSAAGAKELLSALDADSKAEMEAMSRAFDEEKAAAETALKQDWGGDFGRRLNVISALANERGEAFQKFLDDTGVGNHPEMAKLLWDMAEATKEPGALDGLANARPGTSGRTMQEIDADLTSHEEKYSAALRSKSHRDHAFAAKQRLALIKEKTDLEAAIAKGKSAA